MAHEEFLEKLSSTKENLNLLRKDATEQETQIIQSFVSILSALENITKGDGSVWTVAANAPALISEFGKYPFWVPPIQDHVTFKVCLGYLDVIKQFDKNTTKDLLQRSFSLYPDPYQYLINKTDSGLKARLITSLTQYYTTQPVEQKTVLFTFLPDDLKEQILAVEYHIPQVPNANDNDFTITEDGRLTLKSNANLETVLARLSIFETIPEELIDFKSHYGIESEAFNAYLSIIFENLTRIKQQIPALKSEAQAIIKAKSNDDPIACRTAILDENIRVLSIFLQILRDNKLDFKLDNIEESVAELNNLSDLSQYFDYNLSDLSQYFDDSTSDYVFFLKDLKYRIEAKYTTKVGWIGSNKRVDFLVGSCLNPLLDIIDSITRKPFSTEDIVEILQQKLKGFQKEKNIDFSAPAPTLRYSSSSKKNLYEIHCDIAKNKCDIANHKQQYKDLIDTYFNPNSQFPDPNPYEVQEEDRIFNRYLKERNKSYFWRDWIEFFGYFTPAFLLGYQSEYWKRTTYLNELNQLSQAFAASSEENYEENYKALMQKINEQGIEKRTCFTKQYYFYPRSIPDFGENCSVSLQSKLKQFKKELENLHSLKPKALHAATTSHASTPNAMEIG